jgi:hypothetical protein
VSAGYGAQWVVIASRPPRRVVVAYTEPHSPATAAKLARGAQVLAVDGVDLVNARDQASVDKLNAGLFPSDPGGSHRFSILDRGSSKPRDVTMVATDVTGTPVQNVATLRVPGGSVGYMLFNDHLATAEKQLISAFDRLASARVDDLVLTFATTAAAIRYRERGRRMIAGPAPTTGRRSRRRPQRHIRPGPVTGAPLTPVPFHTTSQGCQPRASFSPRSTCPVLVLRARTRADYEAIINGLRGSAQVIQIGTTTCGKPTASPEDNCGPRTSIQFQGVNAKGRRLS